MTEPLPHLGDDDQADNFDGYDEQNGPPVDPDDPESDAGGVDSAALLERTLGAKVIDEIPHE